MWTGTFRALFRMAPVLLGVAAFNLDLEKPTVYSGPRNSYFGYSVDFHQPSPDKNVMSVLVGAPKANTSQPGIVEGGAVYYCPWPAADSSPCRQIPFDTSNNRMVKVNGTRELLEFKSNQWFGASVRTHKGKVVACAPLYHWRTVKMSSEMDPVGTCYVAVQNFSAYAEYSPCRTKDPDPEGQGFCQAGFSVDFTKAGTLVVGGPGSFYWQGQVITAGVAEILNGYSLKAILRKVDKEKQTGPASDIYDDSYLGYSVTVGEFTGDSEQELIAGVPRGAQNFGYVAVINSTDLTFIQNFTGEQMASYFGYTVAVSDLNGDGLDDVLVGAPLYMDREFESKPRELGRVYIYLQEDLLLFSEPIVLSGTDVFGRFGSSIASLGDLNQDGFHDVAVGAPFAGEDHTGRVFIYNGQSSGLKLKPSQMLEGSWASTSTPAGFGFTLRGGSDLDRNDYPDLIVGAFGVDKAVVYRARPVVTLDSQMILNPRILNPEDKNCHLPNTDTAVSCLNVNICTKASGSGIPGVVALNVELQLDWLKQKGAIKRVLFLDTHQHQYRGTLVIDERKRQACHSFTVYLREDSEFRDKLTPISVALNFSLDETRTPPGQDLRPILDYYGRSFVQEQANILLDCGEDNVCIPDLQLSATMDREQLVIGDDNPLMLTIHAANGGEGAYEAELRVVIPAEADYVGVERRREDLQRLNCEYRMENDTRTVLCDLGNPMVAQTNLSVGLRFSVQRLEEVGPHISFHLQIRSSNKDNSESNRVSLTLNISAVARVDIRGVSHPAQVVLPFPRWEPKDKPVKEEDVGPQVLHIYELHNQGPSAVSDTLLQVGWPSSYKDEPLLYPLEVLTEGPLSCRTNSSLNPLDLETSRLQDTPELLGFLRNTSSPHSRKRRAASTAEAYSGKTLNCSNVHCLVVTCHVIRLERGQSAVVKVRSRLWAQTFLQRHNDPYLLNSTAYFRVTSMPYRIKQRSLPQEAKSIGTFVVWATPDVSFAIPLWVIILAVLLGLLVLAILTLVMWKCGFFDRARPPKDDVSDREQLTSEKSEA
ncbi:integrin alpha-8 [Paramormyrops kingsleyae]|uniref:Integrin subunit alpha 8 n=1 Tax=Paramormyrops kingsleyae TaxID=1676925 RepID=A0A3B3QXE5_9TELE|nr:integrin alpha-8 [Paramormyrops kingsleyae]